MKLYGYQHAPLILLEAKRRKEGGRALIVMATGLGKTVVAAFDVRRYLKRNGGRVLYLCHQKDILRQARRTFRAVLGTERYSYGYYHGDKKTTRLTDVLFSTFQTMAGAKTYFSPEEFDYIVVDETHHSHAPTYLPTVQYWQPKFLLGITATPDRADLRDIRQFYGEELYSLPIERAIARNLLTPVSYNLMSDEIQDLNPLELPAGKLSLKQLNRKFFLRKRDEEIAEIIQRHAAQVHCARTIIFCATIEHADRFAQLIPNAAALHSCMPRAEYRERLRLFRKGDISTAVTVDKFNEGIDIPEANLLVFLRSTGSKTIFLQQLGRGLRRCKNKSEVVVLDFVRNCERLLLLNQLRKDVEREEKLALEEQADAGECVEIFSGRFSFSSTAIDLLEMLHKIQRGYTREDLVQQLQNLGKKLGRRPVSADIRKASLERQIASPPTFCAYFGSLANALVAAGYSARVGMVTKERAIHDLRKLAQDLGRVPRQHDVQAASADRRCVSPGVYRDLFGSHAQAVAAAGFKPVKRPNFSRDDLLQQLQSLGAQLGRAPGSSDLAIEGMAPYTTFKRQFGTFQEALKQAGFGQKLPYSKEHLIGQLHDLTRKLGRVPMMSDVYAASKQGESASCATFAKHFGTFRKALEAAGYTAPSPEEIQGNLLTYLRELAAKLGRFPTVEDVRQDYILGGKFSLSTYYSAFGSYKKVKSRLML